MSAEKYTFKENELIWAKMKGYPHWPAKVMKPPKKLKSPSNKLFVFFYGTHEHAWMAPADLLPYTEFREKYKKPSARKGFLEAVWEIEEDPSLAISSSVVTPKKKRKKIKKEIEECNRETSELGTVLSLPTASCAVQDTHTFTNVQTETPAERVHAEDESNLIDSQPTSIPSSLEGSQGEPLFVKKDRKRPTRSRTTTPASTPLLGKRRLTRLSQRLKSEANDENSESTTSLGGGSRDELFGKVKTEQLGDSETVKLERVEGLVHTRKESRSTSIELSQEGGTVNKDVPTLPCYTSEGPSVHSHVKTKQEEVDTSKLPEQELHVPTFPTDKDSVQSQQQFQSTESIGEIPSPTKRYSTRTRCNPSGGSIIEKLTQSYSARKEIAPLSSPKQEQTQQHFEQLAQRLKSPERKNEHSSSKPTQSPKRATRMKATGKMQGGKLKMSSGSTPASQRMTRSRVRKASSTVSEGDDITEVNQQQASLEVQESVSEDIESDQKATKRDGDVQPVEVRKEDIHSHRVETTKKDIDVQPVEIAKKEIEDHAAEETKIDQEAKKEDLSTKETKKDSKQQLLLVEESKNQTEGIKEATIMEIVKQPVEETKKDSKQQLLLVEESKNQTEGIKEATIMEIVKQPVEETKKEAEKLSSDQTTFTAVSAGEQITSEQPAIDTSHSPDDQTDSVVPEQSHTTQSIDSSISHTALNSDSAASMEVSVSISLEKKDGSTTATESVKSTDTPVKNTSVEFQLDPINQSDQKEGSKSQGVLGGDSSSEESESNLVSRKHLQTSSGGEDGGTRTSSRRKRQLSRVVKTSTSTTLSYIQTAKPSDQISDVKSVTLNADVNIATVSKVADGSSQSIHKKSTKSSKQDVTLHTHRGQLRSNKRFAKSQSPCSPQKRIKIDEHGSLSDMEQTHSSGEGLMAVKTLQSPQRKVVKRLVRLKNVGGGPSVSNVSKRKETSSTIEGVSPSKKMKHTITSSDAEREKDGVSKMVASETLSVAGDQVKGASNDVSKEQDETVSGGESSGREKSSGDQKKETKSASNKESTLCSPDVPKLDEKSFEPEKQSKISKDEAALPVEQQHEPMEASTAVESSTPPIKLDPETSTIKVQSESQPCVNKVSTKSDTQQVHSTNVDSATTDLIEEADSLEKNRTELVKETDKTPLQSGSQASETKEKSVTDRRKEQDEPQSRDPPAMLQIRPGMSNVEILQAFNYNLKASLTLDAPNVQQALIILRDILDLQCSRSELDKVPDFVHTIRKLRRYSPSSKVMKRAEEVYIKLKALYMKPAQQTSLSLSQKRGPVGVVGFRKRPPTMMEWIQSQNNKLHVSHPNTIQSTSHDPTPTPSSTSNTSKTGISDIISKKPHPQQIMMANAPVVPDKPEKQDVQGGKELPEQRVEDNVSLPTKQLSQTTMKLDKSNPRPDQTEPLATVLNQTGPSSTNTDVTRPKNEPSAISSHSANTVPVRRSTRGSSRKTAKVNYSEMLESEATATSESEDDQMVPA